MDLYVAERQIHDLRGEVQRLRDTLSSERAAHREREQYLGYSANTHDQDTYYTDEDDVDSYSGDDGYDLDMRDPHEEDAPVEEVPEEDAPVEEVPEEDAPVEEVPQEDAAVVEIPRAEPLTLSMLANAAPRNRSNMIGARLYPLIHTSQPEFAGKITGMLLEIPDGELLFLLECPTALRAKIREALGVLEEHALDRAREFRHAARREPT